MSAHNETQNQTMTLQSPKPADPDKDRRTSIELLRQLLTKQIELHDQMLECVNRKREAIRAADVDALTKTCEREQVIVQRLLDLEQRREPLVKHLAGLLGMEQDDEESLTSSALAERLEEPSRGMVQALTAQLREKVLQLRNEHSIVRHAAEALSRHMSGIMQNVQSVMNQTRVYERRGRMAAATPVSSSVDVKS